MSFVLMGMRVLLVGASLLYLLVPAVNSELLRTLVVVLYLTHFGLDLVILKQAGVLNLPLGEIAKNPRRTKALELMVAILGSVAVIKICIG